ncbi:MAG: transglycosylase SLT domain-containing protein [Thermodesulfobacterium sp.]|nr:transglycosylase SLT domain-containing protein [Thermodesulfobacterium sp.]
MDKADEAANDAYQQGQMYLAKVNIDKLKLLQEVQCEGMDLGTYFQVKAKEKGFDSYVAAIIPQESSGNVYATGCDPCPQSSKLVAERHNPQSMNWQWLKAVFNSGLHSFCLRKSATIENTCTVGFGLMQITSHTLSEEKYARMVQPSALYQTKAFEVRAGNYAAVKNEPPNSPYNPCTNIEVGLSILQDKYKICSNRDNPVRRLACAVCYYNGRPDYLEHIRETVISRGQAGLLVRVGFIKDEMLEGLRGFLNRIVSFVKNEEVDKCKQI